MLRVVKGQSRFIFSGINLAFETYSILKILLFRDFIQFFSNVCPKL